MRHVRGIFFLDYVRMLRRSGSANLAQHLTPEDLELLKQQVDIGAWYPMETFERFGLAILAEVVGQELDSIRLWGRAQIPQILTFFPDLKAEGDPRDTIVRFANLMSSLFDYPAVVVDHAFDGEAVICIDYGMSARAEEAASWQTCGFFEALVEASGGEEVRSRFTRSAWVAPGQPSLLSIGWKLPRKRPVTPAPEPLPRLLLVDDERLVLEGLERLLRSKAEVSRASSCDEALRVLEAGTFELVMSDLDLGPGRNGLELLREVARRWPQISRVLHTGSATDEARDALAAGELHAIAEKPISATDLRALVKQLRRG